MNKQAYMLFIIFFASRFVTMIPMDVTPMEIDTRRQEQLSQQLIDAAVAGNFTNAQRLLTEGANPKITHILGFTPLHFAARGGNVKIVRMLLKLGADPNQTDDVGFAPLYEAAQAGHAEIVHILINAGADPNKVEMNAATPLYVSLESGHNDIFKILIDAGADLNKENDNGNTSLHIAADSPLVLKDAVKTLLTAGANPTIKNKQGKAPVDLARRAEIKSYIEEKMNLSKELLAGAQMGRTDIMGNALKKGALINMPDENGNTPLHLAIMGGNIDVMAYLLLPFAKVINFSLKNNEGQTLIDLAADKADALRLIQQATEQKK